MIETFYELDELVAAIGRCARTRPCRSSACSPSTRIRRRSAGSPRRTQRPRSESRHRRDRSEPRRGPPGCAARARAYGRELAALPNVGLASLAGERVIFLTRPRVLAEFAAHAASSARGSWLLRDDTDRDRRHSERGRRGPARARSSSSAGARSSSPADPERQTLLQRKLAAGEFVVSVEIDPPRGGNAHAMLELARAAGLGTCRRRRRERQPAGAGAYERAHRVRDDRARGRPRDPPPRRATRRSRAPRVDAARAAEGIRNVLAVTGDPPEAGDYPGARGVYEVDSIGLSQMITSMNAGEDYNGREIDAPTSFYLGVAVNPAADDLDYELERFDASSRPGAIRDASPLRSQYLESFLQRLGGACPIPLLVGIFYVRSYSLALRLHNEVPGIVVPEHVQQRLLDAGADAGDTGLAIARELVEASRAGRGRLRDPAIPAAARRSTSFEAQSESGRADFRWRSVLNASTSRAKESARAVRPGDGPRARLRTTFCQLDRDAPPVSRGLRAKTVVRLPARLCPAHRSFRAPRHRGSP